MVFPPSWSRRTVALLVVLGRVVLGRVVFAVVRRSGSRAAVHRAAPSGAGPDEVPGTASHGTRVLGPPGIGR